MDEFISNNVNMARGGYTPAEVAALIRLAWAEAKQEQIDEEIDRLSALQNP